MYWQYTTALASLVPAATNPETKTNAARAVASFVFIVIPPIGSVDSNNERERFLPTPTFLLIGETFPRGTTMMRQSSDRGR
jgi:hypothetical protein